MPSSASARDASTTGTENQGDSRMITYDHIGPFDADPRDGIRSRLAGKSFVYADFKLIGALASWHSYPGESCDTAPCWASNVAPVAARVPVVTGEIGDSVCSAVTYVDAILPWLDAHGISYLGWTWNTWGDCDNVLITDYTGTPTSNFGTS